MLSFARTASTRLLLLAAVATFALLLTACSPHG